MLGGGLSPREARFQTVPLLPESRPSGKKHEPAEDAARAAGGALAGARLAHEN